MLIERNTFSQWLYVSSMYTWSNDPLSLPIQEEKKKTHDMSLSHQKLTKRNRLASRPLLQRALDRLHQHRSRRLADQQHAICRPRSQRPNRSPNVRVVVHQPHPGRLEEAESWGRRWRGGQDEEWCLWYQRWADFVLVCGSEDGGRRDLEEGCGGVGAAVSFFDSVSYSGFSFLKFC